MRWIIDKEYRDKESIRFLREHMAEFDTAQVEWIRIDNGRGGHRGLYGRTHYPTREKRTYRISLQIPGPWPRGIAIREKPRYRNADGSWPPAPGGQEEQGHGMSYDAGRVVKEWVSMVSRTRIEDADEAIIFLAGHELFHFLRKSRQVAGRNTEYEADRAGLALLEMWRQARRQVRSHQTQPFSQHAEDIDQHSVPKAV